MRARIVKDNVGYAGEVYGNWSNILLGTKWEGWNQVTNHCVTKCGAKYELRKWKQKECPEEFEI